VKHKEPFCDTKHYNTVSSAVMPSVIMLNVVMLNVEMRNVVKLSFVGPQGGLTTGAHATPLAVIAILKTVDFFATLLKSIC
jgi:hypothetical protein